MNLALFIVSLAAGVIQGTGVSSSIKQLAISLSNGFAAVVGSGVATSLNPATFLSALSGVIAAAKSDPAITPAEAQILTGLNDALVAALTADAAAQLKIDPTQLKPITPIG